MRSKSVENFFQRSNSDARLPSDITDDALPPSPPLLPGSSLPSDNPKPPLSPSQLVQQKPRPAQTHCFLDHVFRRPTSCQLCKHVIVGERRNAGCVSHHHCALHSALTCSSKSAGQQCS
ncbi:SH3 and cysteine-rich domain-containing protein 2-like [Tachysurus ichikawai]